jgi:hypothetical protein
MLQVQNLLTWLKEKGLYHGDLNPSKNLVIDLNTFQLKLLNFHFTVLCPLQ